MNDSTTKSLWVELETNKGEDHYHEGVKLTCSYRGLLSVAHFNRILDHPSDSGFIKLERVYWIDSHSWSGEKLNINPIRFGHDSIYKNFLGAIFLRINQIVAIAPINGEKDIKWIERASKKKEPR